MLTADPHASAIEFLLNACSLRMFFQRGVRFHFLFLHPYSVVAGIDSASPADGINSSKHRTEVKNRRRVINPKKNDDKRTRRSIRRSQTILLSQVDADQKPTHHEE